MPDAPRLKLRAVCLICDRPRPLTFGGWCAGCAQIACGDGDGERAGLPVPSDPLRACRRLVVHLVSGMYRPWDCWPCALLTTWCSECDTPTGEMAPREAAAHLLVGPWVVAGCEGFVPAALRAIG